MFDTENQAPDNEAAAAEEAAEAEETTQEAEEEGEEETAETAESTPVATPLVTEAATTPEATAATPAPTTEAAPATPVTPTATPKPAELKVVITQVGDSLIIGVGTSEVDPIFKSLKGDLAAALAAVPGLVQEAKDKWAANPRYPKTTLPEPVAATPAAPRAPAAPPKPKVQPSFF